MSADERSVLIEAARALHEILPPMARVPAGTLSAGRPGDDYNERGDVRELLSRHGWTCVRGGDNEHWLRPGKEHGSSATLRDRVFYVFSSNAAPFEPERGYAPFHVYTLLEHQGDFAEAARALREQGFGDDGAAVDAAVDLSGIYRSVPSIAPPDDGSSMRDPGSLPEELLRVPGFISAVMDECLATAP